MRVADYENSVENFIDQELQECLDARISTWKDKNYNTS
jgi:hypothetical protein